MLNRACTIKPKRFVGFRQGCNTILSDYANIQTMKKFILSFAVIIAFAFYALLSSTRSQSSGSNNTVATAQVPASETPAPVITEAPVATEPNPAPTVTTPKTHPKSTTTKAPATPTPVASVQASGKFKDGTYTGDSVNVYYGNVQVSVTIQNGALADVQFLQYPNENNTSMRKSNMAMPILKSEAITAQSANVNSVSGASETSKGFKESLTSALSQAS